MSIKYIVGRSGKGKSHYIFNEIEEYLQQGSDESLILLVPEQFTLQAERDLIQKLDLPGIMQVEVLSISRMAVRIFAEQGGLIHSPINEQGKQMVLKKIIDDNSKKLQMYQKASRQDGFISKCSDFLSQLKQRDISPQDLSQYQLEMDDESIAKMKLKDLALIYEAFNKYLEDRYIDTDDYIKLFISRLDDSEWIKNARVWVDGFNTFSPRSIRIIEKIMSLARQTTISFTRGYTEEERDKELFKASWRSYREFHEIAHKLGLKEEIVGIKSEKAETLKEDEILHLEKELFAYPYQPFSEDVNNIELFAASNIRSEVEQLAVQIIYLVRERNYRFKDIAVVCNDLDSYGNLIRRSFEEYRIPFFMDQKKDIMTNPIIQLILSSLDIAAKDYRYEDVFSFFKSGFSKLDIDEYEKLENYVLRFGIRGQQWREEFYLREHENLEALNHYREIFIGPAESFRSSIKKSNNYGDMTRALYQYLEEIDIPQKIELWTENLRAEGRYELLSENTQIWNIIMDIFDQTVEILGEQEVSIREYRRVLEAGFSSIELGIIPTTIDQVLLGNIQRSKSHDIRALFVLGINDGVLPAGGHREELLSDEEKRLLNESGLDLGLDQEMRADEERFLIYNCLSKPNEYLWLSYALANEEGKAMRASLLIERIKKLFPALQTKSDIQDSLAAQLEKVNVPASTFKYLIEHLRREMDGQAGDSLWWDVYEWYYEQENWDQSRELIIKAFFHNNQADNIGREKARKIYHSPVYSSVSRLEQFVKCPFAHFIRYGLRPRERKMYTVEAPDVGELFHNSLLAFAQRMGQEELDWRQMERKECDRIMDEVMDELVPGHGYGVLNSSHRYRYLVKRLKRVSRRAIWTLTEHMKQGDFEPLGHELRFGRGEILPTIEIEMNDGEKLYLEGRIDRLDILDEEENSYVKIIDYKSGDRNLTLAEAYYGLSLQLLIYMLAVLESKQDSDDKELKPAGIFYFKIDDPLVDSDSNIAEVIEDKISKELKMKGLVLQDVNIVRHMDHDIQGYSSIIPVALSKNDSFYNSSVISSEDFSALISHVKKMVQEIAEEIMMGKVRIDPVQSQKQTACDYCPYRGICQFDTLFTANKYRSLRPLNDEEVIQMIREEKEVIPGAEMD